MSTGFEQQPARTTGFEQQPARTTGFEQQSARTTGFEQQPARTTGSIWPRKRLLKPPLPLNETGTSRKRAGKLATKSFDEKASNRTAAPVPHDDFNANVFCRGLNHLTYSLIATAVFGGISLAMRTRR